MAGCERGVRITVHPFHSSGNGIESIWQADFAWHERIPPGEFVCRILNCCMSEFMKVDVLPSGL
jgi:hypothetical protein